MERPLFIDVRRARALRLVRLAPAAIAWHELDGEGNTLVHLIGGEVLTILESQEELEQLVAGEVESFAVKPPKARKRAA